MYTLFIYINILMIYVHICMSYLCCKYLIEGFFMVCCPFRFNFHFC
uniref:Macaca fascicularis brain cDNA clone: QflA-16876, similar to human TruB pseudouridine (psi) synthase homolog 1 (E. coli)(TRUB1), mRNA, RefSeq: NM_139169.3 n=1 Tax=Macaca fascicularis TaxID=9541 RepID=I7G572_MACFA|nr:unnamed protein product [Macaca fascicularis]